MLRVVPDVNVLVEAVISRKGPAGGIVAAWRSGEIELVTCEEIVARFEEVLSRPRIPDSYRHISGATIAASGGALRHYADVVALSAIPAVVSEDPDDDVVLACAVEGPAHYVTSRDRHLLRLGMHDGIPILTAEQFLLILRREVREIPSTYGLTPVSSVATP